MQRDVEDPLLHRSAPTGLDASESAHDAVVDGADDVAMAPCDGRESRRFAAFFDQTQGDARRSGTATDLAEDEAIIRIDLVEDLTGDLDDATQIAAIAPDRNQIEIRTFRGPPPPAFDARPNEDEEPHTKVALPLILADESAFVVRAAKPFDDVGSLALGDLGAVAGADEDRAQVVAEAILECVPCRGDAARHQHRESEITVTEDSLHVRFERLVGRRRRNAVDEGSCRTPGHAFDVLVEAQPQLERARGVFQPDLGGIAEAAPEDPQRTARSIEDGTGQLQIVPIGPEHVPSSSVPQRQISRFRSPFRISRPEDARFSANVPAFRSIKGWGKTMRTEIVILIRFSEEDQQRLADLGHLTLEQAMRGEGFLERRFPVHDEEVQDLLCELEDSGVEYWVHEERVFSEAELHAAQALSVSFGLPIEGGPGVQKGHYDWADCCTACMRRPVQDGPLTIPYERLAGQPAVKGRRGELFVNDEIAVRMISEHMSGCLLQEVKTPIGEDDGPSGAYFQVVPTSTLPGTVAPPTRFQVTNDICEVCGQGGLFRDSMLYYDVDVKDLADVNVTREYFGHGAELAPEMVVSARFFELMRSCGVTLDQTEPVMFV